MEGISVNRSRTKMTEVVLPNDTNPLGILLGGRLLYWMDIAAAICAQLHSQNIAVTVALDHMEFRSPAKTGDIIEIEAQVTHVFYTSLEIIVEAWKKNIKSQERIKVNEAYFTFVVIDSEGNHLNVPPVIPETERDKVLFVEAETRRKVRLDARKVKNKALSTIKKI
jgi:acyl-CoA hydrolase